LKVHLARLAELEYLITHRAERGQGFAYELLFDGDAAAVAHLSGLIDVESLKPRDYDAQRSGSKAQQSAHGRGAVGQRSGPGRSSASAAKPALARVPADPADESSKTHISGADVPPVMSYPKAVAAPSSFAAAAAA
jgi:DNA primase